MSASEGRPDSPEVPRSVLHVEGWHVVRFGRCTRLETFMVLAVRQAKQNVGVISFSLAKSQFGWRLSVVMTGRQVTVVSRPPGACPRPPLEVTNSETFRKRVRRLTAIYKAGQSAASEAWLAL